MFIKLQPIMPHALIIYIPLQFVPIKLLFVIDL